MMHPDTEIRFIDDRIGMGVVATRFIPKGTVTWVQDALDQILQPEQVQKLSEALQREVQRFAFRNKEGNMVLCWDKAKYVNHSFKSNCLSSAYDFEMAVRDIHPGEQLTDDYGYLNIDEPFTAMDEGVDRQTVYPDDLLRYYPEWDAQLKEAFDHFRTVDQPLQEFIPVSVLNKVNGLLEKGLPLDSILTLYYQEKS